MAGVTIHFTNEAGNRRRYRFERRAAGGWDRIEEEYSGDGWRPVGQEIVAGVGVEIDRGALEATDIVFLNAEPATSEVFGP